MNFFSTKREWIKVILFPDHIMDWMDFDAWAWDLADTASDTHHAPLFFSRYADANTKEQRVEIQIKTDLPNDVLTTFFMTMCQSVQKVSFAATDGSDPHAAAYAVSRLLRGKGERLTMDVVHWMLNMTGYSYNAEIRLLCQEAAVMAENLEKLSLR